MARFSYSNNVTLDVCEDLSAGLNGSITFAPVGAAAAGFPLVLSKQAFSNRPIDGDDDRYFGGKLTKEQVLNASTDLMGNALLGIHGHPERSAPPTLAEVSAAIPPLRSIREARLWTATRGSGRDATFDDRMANMGDDTPTPAQAASVLPGLASTQFEVEA
eukprot:7382913-Prymnesium_polylepis.1